MMKIHLERCVRRGGKVACQGRKQDWRQTALCCGCSRCEKCHLQPGPRGRVLQPAPTSTSTCQASRPQHRCGTSTSHPRTRMPQGGKVLNSVSPRCFRGGIRTCLQTPSAA